MTITSIVPCPVTSTVIYYECCAQQCQNTCGGGGPIVTTHQGGYIGTTTVTSYTTVTPDPNGNVRQTITSNGLVIVVVGDDATGQGQGQTQTAGGQNVVYVTQGNGAAGYTGLRGWCWFDGGVTLAIMMGLICLWVI